MALGFLTTTGLPTFRTQAHKSHSTCTRRAVSASAAGQKGNSWESQTNYESNGKGVQSKGLQRLEFVIHQDGRVEERVFGIKGTECSKLTEKIEEALGTVLHTEKTEEYFEQQQVWNTESNTIREYTTNDAGENIPTW